MLCQLSDLYSAIDRVKSGHPLMDAPNVYNSHTAYVTCSELQAFRNKWNTEQPPKSWLHLFTVHVKYLAFGRQ